ncbi:MAG TPA: hypothetical protein VGA38_01300 [Candidatus Limnocylindria bacterium]
MLRIFALITLVAASLIITMTGSRPAVADNGNASPTLSFFSGGNGAHADWLATTDQPPGDIDNQAIRLLTTNGAPTFEQGYAGILVHHVTGIPAADFPDSAFWNKTPCPYFGFPNTLGSPRLVVEFQDALGNFVGYGDLRENVRDCNWEKVSDPEFPTANGTLGVYPNSAWDVMGGPCGFRYNVVWSVVQACFAGNTTLAVFIVADAYGITHLIDDITVNGKTFSSASNNSNGNNDPAGPDFTIHLSLLPPLPLPVNPNLPK